MPSPYRNANLMRRRYSPLVVVALVFLGAAGCQPQQPFYFKPTGQMDHYVGEAQKIEYPDGDATSLGDVTGAKAPFTLDNPKPESYWDIGLQETMQVSLANSTVIRSLGGVAFGPTGAQGNPSALLQSPASAATIYIPALTEADPRFGVEAALSAFDAQLTSSIFWEKNVVPQNTAGLQSEFRPSIFIDDVANAQVQISKIDAYGDQLSITHDMKYNMDNTSASLKRWANDYDTDLQFQIVHPFLRGAGVGFNRIAGPGAQPGQANGVVIARLRTDQSLADFEGAVRNLASDVERAYWNLYYAYRRLDTAVAGRDAALQTWRQVYAKMQVGGQGGGAQEEAQAREQYLLFKGTVEQAQSNLYKTENVLRYMMGLTHSDGRLIRPTDEPTKAKVEFDWADVHAEALVRSVEIRKQKWVIKQREMEMIAAKNYLLPRLDAVARYGWNGVGDLLIDPSRSLEQRNPGVDNTLIPHSAYGSMTSGDFPSWHLGLQFAMQFGFRRELAGVRAAQLQLTRDRKILQEQELELSHQLADAIRDLSQNYQVGQTNYNRLLASIREVAAVQARYDAGTTTIDQVLDAQRRKAEAENDYYRTLVDYTLSITQLHFRKGSLLEYNDVYLAEGPWPAKAYFDARRRARHADASHYIDYGFTQPRVISQGPYTQNVGEAGADRDQPLEATAPAGQLAPPKPEAVEPPNPLPGSQLPAPASKMEGKSPSATGAGRSGARSEDYRVAPRSQVGQNGNARQKGYDLAAMNLRELAGKKDGPAIVAPVTSSPIEKTSFQQSSPAGASPAATESTSQWKSTLRSTTTNEPVANPSSAAADPSASGWKSVQH
jgi:outer membrane protein TolC